MNEKKNIQRINRVIIVCIFMLICIPAITLLKEFARDFILSQEVTYSHKFWLAVCAVIAPTIPIASLFPRKGPNSLTDDASMKQEELRQATAINEVLQHPNSIATAFGITTAFRIFQILVVTATILAMSLLGTPKQTFWLGFAASGTLLIVGTLVGSRPNMPKYLRKSIGYSLIRFLIDLSFCLFWMVYAYAFGYLAYIIWAIIRMLYITVMYKFSSSMQKLLKIVSSIAEA